MVLEMPKACTFFGNRPFEWIAGHTGRMWKHFVMNKKAIKNDLSLVLVTVAMKVWSNNTKLMLQQRKLAYKRAYRLHVNPSR